MNKNIEKEYKVLVSKEQFDTLLKSYPNITFIQQMNTYYDTLHMDIRNQKGAMRIRQIDDSYIFTLKMHNANDLLEFEKEVKGNALEYLNDPEITTLLSHYDIAAPFQRLTSLSTNRAVFDTGYAELCFDISTYNNQTDYEIEYEYKKEHDGLQAFQTILEPINMVYKKNCKSKIKRALDSL